ncbi:hypothetical protein BJ085DRAFT_36763 [Dimargaris cristalligena]|uniref:Galactose oxidase n=1 Tax=Dimargaris cristalligena TaxID=215637 RepID=A0A4Q0A398_9FUNG|nr:hypothetical protein BJ085DRAFT_36763 [Dimargaris cristalligena]|eukprot:RKP39882.1 hypothetical protein BJ085DRAFT_36763 [Dimargaris cristalligena]
MRTFSSLSWLPFLWGAILLNGYVNVISGSDEGQSADTIPALYEHGSLVRQDTLFIIGGRTQVPPTTEDGGATNAPEAFSNRMWTLSLTNLTNISFPTWTPTDPAVNYPQVCGAVVLNTTDTDSGFLTAYGGDGPETELQRTDFYAYMELNRPVWSRRTLKVSRLGRWYGQSGVNSGATGYTVYFGGVDPVAYRQFMTSTIIASRNDTNSSNSDSNSDSGSQGQSIIQTQSTTYYKMVDGSQFTLDHQDNTPSSRFLHTAVMINGTHMAVVGGNSLKGPIDVELVHVLDTVEKTWSLVPTSGATFGSIYSTAAVVYRRKIIFIGGLYNDGSLVSNILTLDTTQMPWQWDTAPTTNLPANLAARYSHSAYLLGRVVLISFGRTEDGHPSQDFFALELESSAGNDNDDDGSNNYQSLDALDLRAAMKIPEDARDYSLYRFVKDPKPTDDEGHKTTIILVSVFVVIGFGLAVFLFWWFKVRQPRVVIDPWTNQPVAKKKGFTIL